MTMESYETQLEKRIRDLESLLEEVEDENAELRKKIDVYEKPTITTSDTYQISASPTTHATWSFAAAGPSHIEIIDEQGWIGVGGETLNKDDISTLKEMMEAYLNDEL